MLRSLFSGGEQTLHTDSATFSLSLAVRLAGELGVRHLQCRQSVENIVYYGDTEEKKEKEIR